MGSRNAYKKFFKIAKVTMDSREAYKKFCKITKGPVDEEQFDQMFWDEVEIVAEGKQDRDHHRQEALDRMKWWYGDAFDNKAFKGLFDLTKFIASHRRQFTWVYFLRLSHEPDFKAIAYIASLIAPK